MPGTITEGEMPTKPAKTKNKTDYLVLFLGITVVVFALFFLYAHIVPCLFEDMNERAVFGDMYGAFEALFSGLAFVGVLVAIFMQRDELSLQRQELALTRKELHMAGEAQEKSAQALEAQLERIFRAAKIQAGSSIIASEMSGIIAFKVAEASASNDTQAKWFKDERERIENSLKVHEKQMKVFWADY